MSYTLDLARPELAPIKERYVSHAVEAQSPEMRQPKALIVFRRRGQDALLRGAFEKEGWSVESCEGPFKASCPLLRGEGCSLRESVDAAVVYVDPREPVQGIGTLLRLRCAADSSSPAVVALEGRLDSHRMEAGTAVVGALRSPDVVLGAIDELLRAPTKQSPRTTTKRRS